MAASGGAMQFTPNLSLFRLLSTPVSRVIGEREEFAAIGIVSFELLPHLGRQRADLLGAVAQYCERVRTEVVAPADGAAVIVSDEGTRIIGESRRFPATSGEA